ncbi:alpha/beta hydrolase [Sphingomonas bacterium]|uniref:alpha/beta hydrolase n=1 Tax=Sphingomonas bacterium TaxID=1895847 RepID=UPI0020C6F595|nr:alpha/beta hydrolase [Sphingomonas bacterium]
MHRRYAPALLAAAAFIFAAPLAAQMGAMPQGQPGIPSSGVKPVAANQAVLDALKAMNMKPIHTLEPVEARLQPTFADGVKAVLTQQGKPTTPPPGVNATDITVRGAAGPLHAKLYKPAAPRAGRLPVILYFHGGGWVIASSAVYDSSPRALVRETGAIVISVDYRLAPETKFPGQHDDAYAAYQWALANAASLGGDPAKMVLAGESAGGNLAVATAIAARAAGKPLPVAILAVYPVAGTDLNTPSYQENANAMPLSRAGIAWFVYHTTRSPADASDPRLNLVAADLHGLPPVTIIAAQIDPLRSDGQMLEAKLRAAGVKVTRREYPGTTHEFFGADAVIPEALAAQQFAGAQLRTALGK